MDEGSWSSLFSIVLLLLFAAFFALIETAFASVNRVRIKAAMDRGDGRAKSVLYVLDNFDMAITTMLIGVNIVHIASAAITTMLVTKLFGMSYVALGTVVITIIVFFAGEMLPKSIGRRYDEWIALQTAGILKFLMFIFNPLARVLTAIGNSFAKKVKSDAEVTVTEDELYDIIETMKDEGELDAEQGELVHSALAFGDVSVDSVLTPRVDMAAIDIDDDPMSVLSYIKEQRHSRIPVYRDTVDNIIGVLQIRKYLKAYLREPSGVRLEELLDEPYFVHESAKIDELLTVMSKKKLNIAIVSDSFGGTLGVVTMEDILEELVGEIWDEDDVVVESFRELPGGAFEVDAETNVEEVFDRIDFEDPEDRGLEHKLMGEWAYEESDLMPKKGDSFIYYEIKITVSEMRGHRITKLIVEKVDPAAEECK